MQALLQFVKDWVPSIGVVVAGIWILFKWLYEQKQRQREEMLQQKKDTPSLEGKLAASFIPFGKNKNLVTVEAIWKNRSPFPVYMNINKCRIDIYEIPEHVHLKTPSLVLKKDLGEPICSHNLFRSIVNVNYFFEPNTESTLTNYFLLTNGLYGIRMVLDGETEEQMWWKETVLNIQEHK